jgi:phage tail-like protein
MTRHKFRAAAIIGSLTLICLALVSNVRLRAQNTLTGLLSDDGPGVFLFQLELEGQLVGEYTECTGLGSSNDIETSVVQTEDGLDVQEKTPGALEWRTITLKRKGLSESNVWAWRQRMEAGNLDDAIRDGAIHVLDAESLGIRARWEFKNGWPAGLTVSEQGEELVIVHEGLGRADESPTRVR